MYKENSCVNINLDYELDICTSQSIPFYLSNTNIYYLLINPYML